MIAGWYIAGSATHAAPSVSGVAKRNASPRTPTWRSCPVRPGEIMTAKIRANRFASSVQTPDFEIENARESDPNDEWQHAEPGHRIDTSKAIARCQNYEPLRYDVQHPSQRAVKGEEHPRPCCIERKLREEEDERSFPARET